MLISEVFGFGVEDQSEIAWNARNAKLCPFRNSACTKSSKTNPIGICSLSDGLEAASLCPVRFIEDDRCFYDAASLAFGEGVSFGVFPEIRILKIETGEEGKPERKIGKIDYLLGKIEAGKICDFAAVEVQAVYFSGEEVRSPLNYFLEHRKLDLPNSERRADFRSSAQKRLVPQLQLKVPIFRRWGKKFFVVVDNQFFRALPEFKTTTQSNSELTWLSYPIFKTGKSYKMKEPNIVFSEWDEIQNSLREGSPPEPREILEELQLKLDGPARTRPKLLET
ncbi:MAG: NotI family restriction endonuclease [Rhodospirillaceae bacterium]